MNKYSIIIDENLANIRKRLDFAQKELKRMPKGRLAKHGNLIMVVYYRDGERFRKSITSQPQLIASYIRKEMLEREFAFLTDTYKALSQAKARMKDFDLNEEVIALKNRIQLDADVIWQAVIPKEQNDWANEPYQQFEYRPEEKRHVTSKGLKVRSKSEVLIAEKLYEYGIPFRYEQVQNIENYVVAPDFTTMRKDGKLVYWEHEGLTNSEKYIKWQAKKTELYLSIGIAPWDNLIVTYDDQNGNIDTRIVEAEIRNKLLL